MSNELKTTLIDIAKGYIQRRDDYGLFQAELGWEDWMTEFCDEADKEDGAELSERSTNTINEFLKKIWKDAEEELESVVD